LCTFSAFLDQPSSFFLESLPSGVLGFVYDNHARVEIELELSTQWNCTEAT
jgi:hypothetical protein